MRTTKINIRGTEYTACFSTRVVVDLEERFGDITKGLERIMSEKKVSEMFWLLSRMLNAGKKYCDLEGVEAPEPPTEDQLLDLVGIDEYETMFSGIADAVKAGNEQKIQTKPKNAKAAPKAV